MDWLTGLLTIVTMQLIAAHKWQGWAVGLLNQAFWIALIIQQELWGLAPLPIILTIQFAWALHKWRKDDSPATV